MSSCIYSTLDSVCRKGSLIIYVVAWPLLLYNKSVSPRSLILVLPKECNHKKKRKLTLNVATKA